MPLKQFQLSLSKQSALVFASLRACIHVEREGGREEGCLTTIKELGKYQVYPFLESKAYINVPRLGNISSFQLQEKNISYSDSTMLSKDLDELHENKKEECLRSKYFVI